jgi:hypothetical protein
MLFQRFEVALLLVIRLLRSAGSNGDVVGAAGAGVGVGFEHFELGGQESWSPELRRRGTGDGEFDQAAIDHATPAPQLPPTSRSRAAPRRTGHHRVQPGRCRAGRPLLCLDGGGRQRCPICLHTDAIRAEFGDRDAHLDHQPGADRRPGSIDPGLLARSRSSRSWPSPATSPTRPATA